MATLNVLILFLTLVFVEWTHVALAAPTTISPDSTASTTSLPPPTVPSEPHHQIYERLVRHTRETMRLHANTYHQFRSERFGTESDITIPIDIGGPHIPNSNELPNYIERNNMTIEDLLILHYNKTVAYQRGIEAVYMDEESRPNNYFDALHVSRRNVQMVRHNIQIAMLKEGMHEDILMTPVTPCEFTENVNDSVRNMRNLYVLQELHTYLVFAFRDFNRIWFHYPEIVDE